MQLKILFLVLLTGSTLIPSRLTQAFAQTSNASDQEPIRQEFRDFQSFRTELLAKIGSATKRVWIATDFLSDAEIVSSLFIAQYRKVNISVLLGKDRATNILSRLNYLKQVNIPVALRPKDFYTKIPSLILIDNSIFGISTILDSSTRSSSKITLELLSSSSLPDFESKFTAAAQLQNAPKMAPLPQVGRARPNSKYYRGKDLSNPAQTTERSPRHALDEQNRSKGPSEPSRLTPARAANDTPSSHTPDRGNSYRYEAVREKAPEGVPTRLPKTTLRQELERERGRLRNPESDPSPNAD